jgi:UDPglucose 6-dehydrogenase
VKISVIGCGYLGAVHAATLASMGHTVVGIDVDPARAEQLSGGRGPLPRARAGRAPARRPRHGPAELLHDFAPTPPGRRCTSSAWARPSPRRPTAPTSPTWSPPPKALLPHLAGVPPSSENQPCPWAPRTCWAVLAARPDVLLGWNPEFLRQGTAVKDSLVPDRLVYGVDGGRRAAFAAHGRQAPPRCDRRAGCGV